MGCKQTLYISLHFGSWSMILGSYSTNINCSNEVDVHIDFNDIKDKLESY